MLNNELPEKNAVFKERLTKVKYFGMWRWMNDAVIIPRDSYWFFSWDEERNPIEPKELQMYEEDWLGLRTLFESVRMFFYTNKGNHMHFKQWMIDDYLAPMLLKQTPKPSEY